LIPTTLILKSTNMFKLIILFCTIGLLSSCQISPEEITYQKDSEIKLLGLSVERNKLLKELYSQSVLSFSAEYSLLHISDAGFVHAYYDKATLIDYRTMRLITFLDGGTKQVEKDEYSFFNKKNFEEELNDYYKVVLKKDTTEKTTGLSWPCNFHNSETNYILIRIEEIKSQIYMQSMSTLIQLKSQLIQRSTQDN
jgi:hypothetical protein